jgi:hypothetical protein
MAARTLLAMSGALLVVGLAWPSCAPIEVATHEALFAIPKGTWARRMSGSQIEILPSTIRLTLGLDDILVLRNDDDVPQIFGPTLIMPGQTFKLPFDTVAETEFACTAHASGQMTVIVDEHPRWPWQKLAWRARAWARARSAS